MKLSVTARDDEHALRCFLAFFFSFVFENPVQIPSPFFFLIFFVQLVKFLSLWAFVL